MTARLQALVLCAGVYLLGAVAAMAEARLALVVGNADPATASDTAPADAELLARTLEGLGFAVTRLGNADGAAMTRAVAEFGRALREAGGEATGLFYYAGPAVQSDGRNYLLPAGALVETAADLELVAVDAEAVLRQMTSAQAATSIFILDASRSSPFPGIADLATPGLAEMAAPPGTFLAFAAAPGMAADPGAGVNSPYAKALGALMISQGKPIDTVFDEVRVAVEALTGGAQSPWVASGLAQPFYLAPLATSADEDAFWAAVKASGNPLEIEMFLQTYPTSVHRTEAEALLAAAATPEPTPAPEAPAGTAAPADAISGAAIAFQTPLTEGPPEIVGMTIEQLIQAQPLYPPIEGLPDEAWKGLQCKDCHQWEKANLCDQGMFYVNDPTFAVTEKQHPLGGAFKQTLRRWAELGCP